jgi:hypothetical protein
MENSNGTAGSSYYYVQNGPAEGTPPAVGTDLSVVNNFSTALMTFQVKARWFDRSTTQIYDTANLKNDLNVDEANAISKSQLILFKSFMSILSSNP